MWELMSGLLPYGQARMEARDMDVCRQDPCKYGGRPGIGVTVGLSLRLYMRLNTATVTVRDARGEW